MGKEDVNYDIVPAFPEEVNLVEALVSTFPELQDEYETHMGNDEEVLPHLFFWDMIQHLVASFLNRDKDDALDWSAILDFLEKSFLEEQTERTGQAGESYSVVDSLIATAFLGQLPWPGTPGYGICSHLGPTLMRRFRQIRPHG
ncbi:hypothetical protein OG342_38885 [Streptomyces bobili]|uniref:hypothetical protein n=1 Tax=Streptomyces bobili TaxID=67280 RepID=UPI002250625C|nr:hypothetical protein [Streptomyces bobili]MCX5528751.1 hypothetical protein [Streptomyces bobili]